MAYRTPSTPSTQGEPNAAALLSASHAYRGKSPVARTSSASSVRSENAVAAAVKAGDNGVEREGMSLTISPSDFRPVHKRSFTMEGETASPSQQTTRLQMARAPSHTAALVAAARASESRPDPPQVKSQSKPSVGPKPRRLSTHRRSQSSRSIVTTDSSPIPPTTSLVDLFERKNSTTTKPKKAAPLEPIVIKPATPLPIQSPKPLRHSDGLRSVFQMEVGPLQGTKGGAKGRVGPAQQSTRNAEEEIVVEAGKKKQEDGVGERGNHNDIVSHDRAVENGNPASGYNDRHKEGSRESRQVSANSTGIAAGLASGRQAQKHEVGSTIEAGRSSQQSESTRQPERQGLAIKPSTESKQVASQSRDIRSSVSPANHLSTSLPTETIQLLPSPSTRSPLTPSPLPLTRTTTAPIDIRPRPAKSSETLSASAQSAKSVNATYRQLYPSRKTPLKTGDDLANAIVASSLASTRLSSPQRRNPPPPPATRRRSHHAHHIFHSRTPSPSKTGLRQTLRKQESDSSDEEDEHPYSKHQKKRLIRKHPNKHHEGDRKRWRDAVTEGERKRYEGVWAANKGLFMPVEQQPPDSRLDPDSLNDQVTNIITKDIWSRSRLPDFELEAVWDLVDTDESGRLTKQEFVVGMWLIDQRLKGRKLPVKVQPTVWASVKSLQGIKVKKK